MKVSKIYISLLFSLTLSSCSKEFLDLKPISSATSDNFYKTADDFKNAVNGAYASLQSGGIFGNSYVFGDVASDNTVPPASGSVTDQDEFDRFYIKTTNPFISGRWNDSYTAIARYNTILDKIGGVSMDENLKNRYIAETKFLRAMVYFNLVRTFGDVPLVLKAISNPDEGYEYGRSPKADVYAQIEKDLTDAEGVLPVSYATAEVGRATKGAAKALLGKVYLTEKKYAQAVAKLKEVIDLGVYDILPNYADVFKVSNKNNKESVFDVQYKSGGAGEGNSWPNSFAPENSGNAVIAFGGGGNNQPTADLINAYESGDKRKDVSLATSYVNASGQTIPYNFVKKYYDTPATNGDNGNNIPVIRYADVLLMYAESLNEVGYQSNGDAFAYLNKIRNRAGLASKTATDIPTQQAFRLAMEQERRVEFAFEGQRWYDLVRTDRAIPVLNSKKDQIRLVNVLTENNLVDPIPQSQIDINRSKIQQNPGY
ncbi:MULTISPECIES: RagB/SusD family nutrient uptake outer membrane protein [unclassified Spirosoma]|uniref:RagB/SusD family nutrient uptake outer membrane protein n=1 Tax=unclassified Spirosoma TaxID=2621999 RepID=UPI000967BB0E|nr:MULTISPECIES: RagB/SusD family nutrient uptake outer membrane protein [unclassified Spirosoma]MBN8824663.1 RagB/SusD family nutrient uptake outer membrane protein [Spirosoma sp.]OJW78786.1 MAG: RagB/SusD family nutrient uptake outer membrane protein [Spirosoma sp. 48-14]